MYTLSPIIVQLDVIVVVTNIVIIEEGEKVIEARTNAVVILPIIY